MCRLTPLRLRIQRKGIGMEIQELSIPKDWDDITPRWMTAALSNHFPGAGVSAVTLLM
jgi:hypothetical protein